MSTWEDRYSIEIGYDVQCAEMIAGLYVNGVEMAHKRTGPVTRGGGGVGGGGGM